MGNPLSKASEGGWVDILREREEATQSEVEEVSGMCVLIRVRRVSSRLDERNDLHA